MNLESKKLKLAFGLNLFTALAILFSSLWMFSGLHFGDAPSVLEGQRLSMFKFYTVDSNILMGFIACFVSIVDLLVLKGKLKDVPVWVYVLKLVGVLGVTLTMLVTIFFLVPTMGFFACFNNSNLFLHFINPVAAIITFICFESTDKIKFGHTFTGISTMLIYAVYYVVVAAIHSTNNIVHEGYDWYGFLVLGLKSGFIVIPVFILITYGICVLLWFVNRKVYKAYK